MSPKKSNQLDFRIRLLTATIAGCFLLGSLLIVQVDPNLAYSQTPNNLDENNGDDLSEAVVPAFDFNNNFDKSIVVLLNFTELNKAEFVDSDVSYGPPHSNIGNPPSLRLQIYDYSGGIIQQFNYWHPLFYFEFQEGGNEHLNHSQNAAVGRFVFAFDPNAALMKVSYLHHDGVNNTWAEEVISVNLIPTISRFCDQFRDDPDCRSSDLSVVDVSTSSGQQQLPLLIGSSADVNVQTTVTNTGPDAPIDATLSSKMITPSGSDGVLVTPAAAGATTIVTPLNEREQYDQTYTIECWEPGIHNIIFESEIASQSGAVDDANQLNNKAQMNFEVDCRVNGVLPPAEPLGVSIEANATEDGSPPTTINFRAITVGGTQPYKFRWNFDDASSNNNNDVKGNQLMTHQFTRLGQYNVTVSVTDSANGFRGQTASDNIIITISDTIPPQISCPPNITVEATGPNGARVTFTASAIDNVDGPVPVSSSPRSGDIFPIGNTTVVCTAADAAGNSATKSFTVTVTPPRCPVENQSYDSNTGQCIVRPTNCSDGSDNDGDGKVDGKDPDCIPTCPAENQRYDSIQGKCIIDLSNCSDLEDNDGDGKVDGKDPDCIIVEICNDGIDNDRDGSIDENCPEICNDGIDNDRDGSIDEVDCQCPTEVQTLPGNYGIMCPASGESIVPYSRDFSF